MRVDSIVSEITIEISESNFLGDLYILELGDFDVILGMDWLDKNKAKVDYAARRVNLRSPEGVETTFEGVTYSRAPRVISAMKAVKMLRKKSCQ